MEDAHTTLTDLEQDNKHISFFAVFDGHGGTHAAKFSGKNLHLNIVKTEEFKEGKYQEALKNGFLNTDSELRADPTHEREPSGCTAVAVLITDDHTIYCANAGDSRAVLSNSGIAVPLSFDHKPSNQGRVQLMIGEYNRIVAAGGFVEFGRVNGNLALSRAIGDFEFKSNPDKSPEEQAVTCNPDILERAHQAGDEFFVIACDGIWDCMTNQQVVDFVSEKLYYGMGLSEICEAMTDRCLAADPMAGIGCDNMTVIICAILAGQTVAEWTEKVVNRYKETAPVSNIPEEGVN
ncbi:Protein phosphatase 2C 2 [Boothiomyces sp. JEL0838]|nr:Protein phosphatase 2C 2 [Boothiomyces sp. JEL0838]